MGGVRGATTLTYAWDSAHAHSLDSLLDLRLTHLNSARHGACFDKSCNRVEIIYLFRHVLLTCRLQIIQNKAAVGDALIKTSRNSALFLNQPQARCTNGFGGHGSNSNTNSPICACGQSAHTHSPRRVARAKLYSQ